MINKLKEYFFQILIAGFLLFLVFLALRFFELYLFKSQLGINHWEALGPAIGFDLKLTACIVLIPGFIFLPLAFWKPRVSYILVTICYLILILLQITLIQYYFINLALLDNSVLLYTIEELVFISKTEIGHIKTATIVITILSIGLSAWIYYSSVLVKISQTKWKYVFSGVLVLLVIITLIDYPHLTDNQKRYGELSKFCFVNNKTLFLAKSIYNSVAISDQKLKDIDSYKPRIKLYQKEFNDYHYVNDKFPFLHDDPYSNELGPYFKKSTKAPNIVFLIVESLSRSFSGPNAYYGSFTPFIDSLSKKSLYWENALSCAPRTFGVFANSLASLPQGLPDIIMGHEPYPKFNSVISQLNKNGYESNFYYGAWAGFTNYDAFLQHMGVKRIIEQRDFDTTKYHIPKRNHFVWGYYDNDMFNQSFDFMDQHMEGKPMLNIYLTVGMHSPNNVYPEKYNINYLNELISRRIIPQVPKSMQGDIVLSILANDDALREFFNKYKERKDFENTIFVIYGDHNINSLPLRNEIDIYHVPIIIYSPLLRKSDSFKGVVSHRDITPGILSLLQHNYSLQFSKAKHWLSKGLDTSHTFQSKKFIPLHITSDMYPHFLVKNYLVKNDILFKVTKGLELSRINDSNLLKEIKYKINLYKEMDEYSLAYNTIVR